LGRRIHSGLLLHCGVRVVVHLLFIS
jgi:hypothetical protein